MAVLVQKYGGTSVGDAASIRGVAEQSLFVTLQNFGYQLVAQGSTSIDEVDRVAGSD